MLIRIACAIALTIAANDAMSASATPPVIELMANGEIQIAPDGHVSDYKLKSDLAPTVAQLVDRTVRGWHFEPVMVDGKAVNAKTTMTIRLHGEPTSDDSYTLRIASVDFGELTHAKIVTPEYPYEASHAGLGARVELYLLVGEDGHVLEATPRQTSLDMRTKTESDAEIWRARFERASIKAAKQWRYAPSESVDGKPVRKYYAIAPIDFVIANRTSHDWRAYVPGPLHPSPWGQKNTSPKDEKRFAELSDGETISTDSNFHLKDDVVGKTL